jgi:hypothetical protein
MEDWEEHNVVGPFAERPLAEYFHFSLPMSLSVLPWMGLKAEAICV